jgi:hypothetical protein
MWQIDRGTNQLRAYNATNLANQLWTSAQAPLNRDQLGAAVKFSVPTIADGLVFCGTNTALVVYGPPIPPNLAARGADQPRRDGGVRDPD